ncbi:MAG: tRNA-(ms[2]io[6]A)-hydroxylase [Nannocystaceae bacterium]|nr:tRNA-(ms[2]io[6]A)-hydroxylase [Nannocystaceae bacterium]
MLHLRSESAPGWGLAALAHLDEILLDHAHCEKKAASTALGLLFRYPEHEVLARPLSALAREELEHFERVLDHVTRRGGRFGRLPPPPYAASLMTPVRTHEPARAVDTLLCCALIEARSCERMQRLHEALQHAEATHDPRADPALRELYGDLLACEARHHGAYLELARVIGGDRSAVDARLQALAQHEAAVLADAPVLARMHARL